ncbi:hypothetical protein Tco_0408484 [Tanacetum coccineum]
MDARRIEEEFDPDFLSDAHSRTGPAESGDSCESKAKIREERGGLVRTRYAQPGNEYGSRQTMKMGLELKYRMRESCSKMQFRIRMGKLGLQNIGNGNELHRSTKKEGAAYASDSVVDCSKGRSASLTSEAPSSDIGILRLQRSPSMIQRNTERGETVDQHPATVEETRAYFESLYNNLAIEVEKVNSDNSENGRNKC